MRDWFQVTVKVTVDGREYEFDTADIKIVGRSDPDLRTGASKLSFFLGLRARARRELAFCRADYERWKAREIDTTIGENKTLAEWKSKNKVEASKQDKFWKQCLAQAEEVVESITALIRGYDAKIELLRTQRADERKERDVAGEIDPVEEGTGTSMKDRRARNNERVRRAMRKGE